jgi:TolB protein
MGVALPGSWSPNGRYLALSQSIEGNSEIYVYELHRKSLKRLTRHPSIDISPSFAPDSTRLVLTSDRSGSPQLYLTDVHGRLPTRLTTIGHYNTSPVWSPRDDTIAFVGRSVEGTLDIYTIRADGSNLRRLTRGGQSHESPTWAPNGRFVMYTSRDGKMQQRHIIRIDGQEDRILPQSGPVCHSLQWVARHTR